MFGRYAHAVSGYANFVVAFGGSGPYIEKIKIRMMYNDLIVFDLEKNDFVKFDGDVTSYEETR